MNILSGTGSGPSLADWLGLLAVLLTFFGSGLQAIEALVAYKREFSRLNEELQPVLRNPDVINPYGSTVEQLAPLGPLGLAMLAVLAATNLAAAVYDRVERSFAHAPSRQKQREESPQAVEQRQAKTNVRALAFSRQSLGASADPAAGLTTANVRDRPGETVEGTTSASSDKAASQALEKLRLSLMLRTATSWTLIMVGSGAALVSQILLIAHR